jgi:polyferredoxin
MHFSWCGLVCGWMALMDLIKLLDREEDKRRRNKETSKFFFKGLEWEVRLLFGEFQDRRFRRLVL